MNRRRFWTDGYLMSSSIQPASRFLPRVHVVSHGPLPSLLPVLTPNGTCTSQYRSLHDRQGRGPPGVRLGDDEVPHFLKEPISRQRVVYEQVATVDYDVPESRARFTSHTARVWHETVV